VTKTKKKTQISAYVSQELGEWLRDMAYKTRKSQGQIIREALKEYKGKYG